MYILYASATHYIINFIAYTPTTGLGQHTILNKSYLRIVIMISILMEILPTEYINNKATKNDN